MGVRVREAPKGSGVYFVFINHNGKRKSKKIGRDKKMALEVAKKIEAKLVLGELSLEKMDCPTFRELADKWIKLPHDWKESTREGYENNLRLHILPALGHRRIDQLKRKDIIFFFDGLSNTLHINTLRLIKAPLSGVFAYALDLELIGFNPVKDITLKYKSKKHEIKPLSESEADKLLEQVKDYYGGFYYAPILLMLRTGMRIGEARALKWDDLDFDKRQIEVKRSFRRGRLTRTKTGRRRRVDMTPALTKTLREHQTAQKRRALEAGKPFSEFVFTQKSGRNLDRKMLSPHLKKCCRAIGVHEVGPHNLRHTYATLRLMRGHNVGDVAYQLGHSSIKMTYDRYTHWMPGNFKSEVDDLDNPATAITPK